MKDHNGNSLEVGDWVKFRSKSEGQSTAQIIKTAYGQVVVKKEVTSNEWRSGVLPPRNARVFIKLEPEELI